HFPTTSNGKVDRKNLPLPINEVLSKTTEFISPRNDTEQLIHNIWANSLSLNAISVNNNFFELGGHSLIAVRVMLSLEKETGIRLPISRLFENSTIEKLAEVLNQSIEKEKKQTADFEEPEKGSIITIPAIDPQTEIWVAC